MKGTPHLSACLGFWATQKQLPLVIVKKICLLDLGGASAAMGRQFHFHVHTRTYGVRIVFHQQSYSIVTVLLSVCFCCFPPFHPMVEVSIACVSTSETKCHCCSDAMLKHAGNALPPRRNQIHSSASIISPCGVSLHSRRCLKCHEFPRFVFFCIHRI